MKKLLLSVSVIFILGIAIRLYSLFYRPWNADEFWTLYWIKNDIKTIIWGSFADFRPPLYYLSILGWQQLVGDSLLGLRWFSFFISLFTLFFIYRLGRRLGDNSTARWATLLVAIGAGFVVDATDSRMFALGLLSTVVVIWSILAFIQTQKNKYLIYNTVALAVAIYTYHYLTLLIVSVWLFTILAQKRIRPFFLLSQSIVFILSLPFIYFFYASLTYFEGFHQYLSGSLLKPASIFVVPFLPAELILGLVHKPEIGKMVMFYAGTLIVFFGTLVLKACFMALKTQMLLLVCFTLVPVGILFIFSTFFRPLIGIHSLIFFEIPLVLLTALSIKRSRILKISTLTVVSLSALIYFLNFPTLTNDKTAFVFLKEHYSPMDTVLVENIYPLLWTRYYSSALAKSLIESPHNSEIQRVLKYEVIPIESVTTPRVFLIQENLYAWFMVSKNMLRSHSYILTQTTKFPTFTFFEFTKKN